MAHYCLILSKLSLSVVVDFFLNITVFSFYAFKQGCFITFISALLSIPSVNFFSHSGVFKRLGVDVEWTDVPQGTGAMIAALKDHSAHVIVALTEGLVKEMALTVDAADSIVLVSNCLHFQ